MRPQAYTLVSSDHGTMIVNRFDFKMVDKTSGYGVGFQILNKGSYEETEVSLCKFLLNRCLKDNGPGVVAIDCGANIGVHTIEWGKMLQGKGSIISFEPQKQIYYALCGNIAINNCFNVTAYNLSVGDKDEIIDIPMPNYFMPSTFGSMELKQHEKSEDIGQTLNETVKVEQIRLDALPVSRVDFIKIDVEGMEFEVLEGAKSVINRYKPIMLIEVVKIDQRKMKTWLVGMSYETYLFGGNFLAVHKSAKIAKNITLQDRQLRIE
jgi:FkbM family methyltransferase